MTRAAAIAAMVFGLLTLLGGCETPGRSDTVTRLYGVGEAGGASKRLIPYTTLTGYLLSANVGPGAAGRALLGLSERVSDVKEPVAVGAGDGGIYVIDALSNALYRFRWQIEGHADKAHLAAEHRDLTHPELVRLRTITEIDEPGDLFVAPNGDLFVSDPRGARVVQYDRDGRQVREFKDEANLKRPVAVTLDSRGLRIFVADGLYDRIVVFNPQGVSLYAIGQRGDGPGGFKNVRTMVQGKNGLLYVVNGVAQQIQTYGVDGTYVSSFGKGTFTDPEGIAVDDDNRVYVADRFNHRILIFQDGKLVETFGRYGIRGGEFNQPSRLVYHQGFLYVADRQNGRVQVLRVVPESYLRQTSGEPG